MAEQSTYKKQEFCTTEGGVYLGHCMTNNAKMAAGLRRIFPAYGYKRSQYIGLQQGGALDGGIVCSTPTVFQIACGEQPAFKDKGNPTDNGVAGVWHAENGDIIIGAPNGRIRMFAESIDLLVEGDGEKTGYVNITANGGLAASCNRIEMEADDNMSLEGHASLDLNTTGRLKESCGTLKCIQGADVLKTPGTGNLAIWTQLEEQTKLISALVK